LTKKVDTLVIGGGAMGLSVAYNLLKRGREIHVLEASYFNAGSTGRNVGVLKSGYRVKQGLTHSIRRVGVS
jgi:glycine/D-amino acid oxidase-like deaminating enzyme